MISVLSKNDSFGRLSLSIRGRKLLDNRLKACSPHYFWVRPQLSDLTTLNQYLMELSKKLWLSVLTKLYQWILIVWFLWRAVVFSCLEMETENS